METREMSGVASMEGAEINSLRILDMVDRYGKNGQPRYTARCGQCQVESIHSHESITTGTARCPALGCGKTKLPTRRERQTEMERKRLQKLAELERQEREAAEERMALETADYELLPTRPRSVSGPVSERVRLEAKRFLEAERAEQEAADQPRIEAERLAEEKQAAVEEKERNRQAGNRSYWADAIQNGADPKETLIKFRMCSQLG